MIGSPEHVAFVVEMMASLTPGMNPCGQRYVDDRRYRVNAIAGHGNGTIDTIYCHVGKVQLKLFIDRRSCFCRVDPLPRNEYFRI